MIKRVTLAALIAASVSVLAPTMQAAHAAVGPYGGKAEVDLVHVDALTIPSTFDLLDAAVSPAKANVKSTGFVDIPNLPAGTDQLPKGKRSHAKGTNLDVEAVDGNIPIDALVVAEQAAPPDNPKETKAGTLIDVPADPLLHLGVATAHAQARWAGDDACVKPGTPISAAKVELASAELITSPTGPSAIALKNDQGPTVYTDSTVRLTDVPGQTTKGVKSESITQLTAIDIGGAGTIEVLAPPTVTAVATGQPGGAKVTYNEPILQFRDAMGNVTPIINATDINLSIPGAPLLRVEVGTLTKTEAPNGTKASGQATLLTLTLLTSPDAIDPLLSVSIAAGTVNAEVPAGGVNCPPPLNPLRDVHKDLSAADVAPGGEFEYSLTVPNRGSCTLTKVKVVDAITGPEGSEILAAVPAPSSTEALTLTWDDIGPLAPNQTKVLKVRVKVPASAPIGAVYHDHLEVSALCDGETVTKPADLDGPTVGQPTGPCDLSASNKAASHLEVLPGQTFAYYVHVANQGATSCDGVKVADTLGPDVIFVSCTDSCTHEGQSVGWDVGTLAGGASRSVSVVVKVKDGTALGTHLPNKADLTTGSNNRTVTVSTPGPFVSDKSVLAPADPARWTRRAGLAATGRLPLTPLGWAFLFLGTALFGLRRRLGRSET